MIVVVFVLEFVVESVSLNGAVVALTLTVVALRALWGSAADVELAFTDAEQLTASNLFSFLPPAVTVLGCKGPLADTDQGKLPIPHHLLLAQLHHHLLLGLGQLHHLWQVQRVARRVHDLVVGPVDGPAGPA